LIDQVVCCIPWSGFDTLVGEERSPLPDDGFEGVNLVSEIDPVSRSLGSTAL
jgi:hypothetical protein